MIGRLRNSFTGKVFFAATTLIVIISVSFIALFVTLEEKALSRSLKREGKLFTNMLAYNTRLGIMSENADLLRDPVAGVMVDPQVLAVEIQSADGRILMRQAKEQLAREPEGDQEVFSSPVFFSRSYSSEEALLFDRESRDTTRPIGSVSVVLSRNDLQRELTAVLAQSVVIMLLFLAAALGLLYVLMRRVTRPLERLTAGVRAVAEGAPVTVPVETEDEIGKLAGSFNDMVAALRKREDEKEALEERLRQAAKMEAVGTLAGGVAHDFNNILTATAGYVNILKKEIPESLPCRSYLEKLEKTVQRAVGVTGRLLAFSRKQQINLRMEELNALVANVEDIVARVAGEKVRVHVDLHPQPLHVLVDSAQLDQVLLNLASNARDAMPSGGELRIATATTVVDVPEGGSATRKPGRYACIHVCDSGSGIGEEIRDRIFDPFFTTKEVGKGTGLGLSMSYGIVKQHGGFIDVRHGDDGTEFVIYLPLMERRREQPVRQEGLPQVLVVESDPVTRHALQQFLPLEGYSVVEAEDEGEAIRLLRSGTVACLMANMLTQSGRHVYDEVRQSVPGTAVIFMGGYRADDSPEEQPDPEAPPLLYKPVTRDRLGRTLMEAFRRVSPADPPDTAPASP